MQTAAEKRRGKDCSFYGKKHSAETIAKIYSYYKKSLPVKITDIETGLAKTLNSNVQAAKYLNISE